MKYRVTDLNYLNKLILFSNTILGNFYLDNLFGELEAKIYPFVSSNTQFEVLHSTQIAEPNYTLVYSSNCTLVASSSNNSCIEIFDTNLWTLYVDGSRNNVGVGVVYLLIDKHGNRTMLACCLEFEFTNNVSKYEELVQGLKKEMDLNVKCIEVFGDSHVVMKHVRD